VQFIYIHTEWWHTAAQEPVELQLYISKAEPLTVAAHFSFPSLDLCEVIGVLEVLGKIF